MSRRPLMKGRSLQHRVCLCLMPFLLAGGCTSGLKIPELGGLYSRAAKHHDERRNPVIVIPGICGSKLIDEKTHRVVWGAFGGGFADPRTPEGAALLALPMREGASLSELTDDVRPNGVLDRVQLQLFFLPVQLRAYANILATLGAGGFRDEELGEAKAVDYGVDHYTCFQFDYDWRRDNVENAKRLHEFVLSRKKYVQNEIAHRFKTANSDVKFDIVAHSMGGLVARYYVRYGDADLPPDGSTPTVTWAGAEHVERVILVGTPNAGSIEALIELADGAEFGPTIPKYEAAVLGTMPSVYQLMPRPRHGVLLAADGTTRIDDFMDPSSWERRGWGLADPEQDRVLKMILPDVADSAVRRRIAVDHQRKCLARAAQFHLALDEPAGSPAPAHASVNLFAGDAVATSAVATLSAGDKPQVSARWPGDGTVCRYSALLDERTGRSWSPQLQTPIPWNQVFFLFTDHLGLTKDPAFSDNVLYLLLEAPRRARVVDTNT